MYISLYYKYVIHTNLYSCVYIFIYRYIYIYINVDLLPIFTGRPDRLLSNPEDKEKKSKISH